MENSTCNNIPLCYDRVVLQKYLPTNTNKMTDYQTKKGRLTKKKPYVDFDLADSDDFFGFEAPIPVSKSEKLMYAYIAFGFGILIYQVVNFFIF